MSVEVTSNRFRVIKLPENWKEEAAKVRESFHTYFDSDAYKNLDDPRKTETGWLLGHKDVPPVYLKDEVYCSYFETFISTKDLLDARARIVEVQAKGSKVPYLDKLLIKNFRYWWINKFTDFPFFEYTLLEISLSVNVDEAILSYLAGRDVKTCYSLSVEKLRSNNIADGAFKTETQK